MSKFQTINGPERDLNTIKDKPLLEAKDILESWHEGIHISVYNYADDFGYELSDNRPNTIRLLVDKDTNKVISGRYY